MCHKLGKRRLQNCAGYVSRLKPKVGRIAGSLLRMDLVILDELGYLPFSQAGGALLFLKAREQARKGPGSGSVLS